MINKWKQWFVDRIQHLYDYDRFYFHWLITFLSATSFLAIIYALGNPLGASFLSHFINIGIFFLGNLLLYFIFVYGVASLFTFLYLPIPKFLIGGFLYTFFLTAIILIHENSGDQFSWIIAALYSFLWIVIGFIFIFLTAKKFRTSLKITVVSLIGLSFISYFVIDFFEKEFDDSYFDHDDGTTSFWELKEEGPYPIQFITYGSGKDKQRKEYGEKVHERTPSVDASHFITRWSKARTKFWGFDETELPLNGRAWIPKGDGPFPLVLIVHGNHTMEYFSTAGYDYLGKHLASKGFITISIDEDFINYSNRLGIPNDNYKLRAWMMLNHLIQLQKMNEDSRSHFYQKINFDEVVLSGHSRGGQAAAMSADYKSFFQEETELLKELDAVQIKGVVAISPTDTSVDNKKARLHNISYLLIHGAKDADVYDFRGDLQYGRTTFDPDDDGFKASVYIAHANHTQFNTNWGKRDLSLPRGIFLDQRDRLTGKEQREITKVFFTAFLERLFHGKRAYEQLFQNYRNGAQFLPQTIYVQKYHPASYQPIITYQKNTEDEYQLHGFTDVRILQPLNRRGQKRRNQALRLAWAEDATYTIELTREKLTSNSYLVLTVANVGSDGENSRPKITLEWVLKDQSSIFQDLDSIMPVPPVIHTKYTRFGLFDTIFRDGKYERSWEPVFQTFSLPLHEFHPEPEKMEQLILHFQAPGGEILMEEIGIYEKE